LQLVECYFDESESVDPSVLCVAGYLYEKAACAALDAAWKIVLDDHHIAYFRMVECAHKNREFNGRSADECDVVARKMIALIKKYAVQGYAVSFNLNLANFLPSAKDIGLSIVSPYSLCCYFCLNAVNQWAKDNGYQGKLAYFFESGHANHAESNRIMNAIFSNAWSRDFYRYSAHAFVDKKEVRPVQSADILAWQWRKNLKDRLSGIMKPRKDLLSLQEIPHNVMHFDESTLREFLGIVAARTKAETS